MKKKLYLSAIAALLLLMFCTGAQAAIDRTAAQEHALKAAGASETDVRRLSVETETHNGTAIATKMRRGMS